MTKKLFSTLFIGILSALMLLLVSCNGSIPDESNQPNRPGMPLGPAGPGFPQNGNAEPEIELSYSSDWSYDDTKHWHACITEGYENERTDEAEHVDSSEQILTEATDLSVGLAQYTCATCGHTYQKTLYIKTSIVSLPTVSNEAVYIGQTLSEITLIGGQGSVDGSFVWSNPDDTVTQSGVYSVTFKPTDSSTYGEVSAEVQLNATQLTVTVSAGENGTASSLGSVNVDYNGTLAVTFTPASGYAIDTVTVDGKAIGACAKYTFEGITKNHTVSVTFKEADNLPFSLVYMSGTENCYTVAGSTVTFTEIGADTVYAISGELDGNIVIDVGESYNFELQLVGFTLSSNTECPITVLSADNVDIKAKAGTENFIYDNREAVDEADETQYSASVYALCDLDICGQGTLTIVSESNNGIHTKDDLVVKNLTLSVTCVDNALKGNDSVTVTNAKATLIATQGDCIKSTNSDISTTNSNQRGIITISGSALDLYAACDGIDASYNVVIDGETTALNIYTDKYSEYSEEVTAVADSTYYVKYSSSSYKYSIKYFNSDTEYEWVNAEYYTSVSGGRSTYYYYKVPKNSNYSSFIVYMYSSSQTQGQDSSYYACSDTLSHNNSYDTIAFSNRMGSLSTSWTNYTTSSAPGGMSEGNTDKGDYSTKGIKASNEIIINAGTINIEAYDDAIHANNDVTLENGETPLGNLTINGGTITVSSNDDGLHADGTMLIADGTVTVKSAYEGIEGAFIKLKGGNTSVTSSDDGLNGASTTGYAVEISGGTLYVNAKGDGIDSNSTSTTGGILFSGGKTVVICNSNGNSAIDSERGYAHTGGQVLAVMSTGGMTSETSNAVQTTGKTIKSSLSLSNGGYLTVTVDSSTVATVKMPYSMTAYVVYLGSSSATVSSVSASSQTLDANGVCWN